MIVSSVITMVGNSNDRTVSDSSVHYRPELIGGRRYHVTTSAPVSGAGSGSGLPPAPGSAR